MSSAVYITPKAAVSREDWLMFCEHHGVVYSPRTIGRNVFYAGEVEVTFGEAAYETAGHWAEAQPPASASRITVSSYHMSNLEAVADLARRILLLFPSTWECDEELEALVRGRA